MTEPSFVLADFGDRLPTAEEIDSAAEALTAIENGRTSNGALPIGDTLLSSPLVELVTDLLSIVARGEAVTYAPISRRLTTQEAADLLNVSRPHLIKLLQGGEIEHEMVGTHRRVDLRDVLDYKARRSAGRKTALAEMQNVQETIDRGHDARS